MKILEKQQNETSLTKQKNIELTKIICLKIVFFFSQETEEEEEEKDKMEQNNENGRKLKNQEW